MAKHLILGASSAIATEAARVLAARGDELFLVGRSTEKLSALEQDLKTRGAGRTDQWTVDLADIGVHEQLVRESWDRFGGFDTVLLAYGVLGDQRVAESDVDQALGILHTNFVSPVSLLLRLANRFQAQGRGCIAVITSVAGDRGRQSNYLYGASKGALGLFLGGLRNRLFRSGVRVLEVRPGFVETPMTAHLKKGALFATAGTVGEGIVRAMDGRREIVYLPWFWRGIMTIIRSIPEPVFKRLRL
jgi:decaprenylphospho-beta-D-erythro-pentofuranosid-2-ulose 2-reductase